MPKAHDPGKGGTNADGSKSKKYCSYCYQNGEFHLADEIDTAQKMQAMCIQMMKKHHSMAHWKAWLFTRGIPRLERWRKK